MELLSPLLAACAVMLVSLVGVIFMAKSVGAWMHRYLTYLATFSAGVFLLVAYHLIAEAAHEGGWVLAFCGIVLGAFAMEAIKFFVPAHHHHGVGHDHGHSAIDGRRVLLSDALHNVGDGILLVGAFAADWYIGIAATIGVLIHETVQEISEYFVLREAGYTNTMALTRNFAVSSTILIGVIFAAFFSSNEIVVAVLSGIAAGGFLSVVFHDLIPHAVYAVRKNGGVWIHVGAALFGAAVMLSVQQLLPHEEPHDVRDTHVARAIPLVE